MATTTPREILGGTEVREPRVLIVEDDASERELLREHVEHQGFRAIEAHGPTDAVAQLDEVADIVLILTDVRMPSRQAGIDFIRTARELWADIPLAVITGHPDDLSELYGRPECPILILPKPIWSRQIDEVLGLIRGRLR